MKQIKMGSIIVVFIANCTKHSVKKYCVDHLAKSSFVEHWTEKESGRNSADKEWADGKLKYMARSYAD